MQSEVALWLEADVFTCMRRHAFNTFFCHQAILHHLQQEMFRSLITMFLILRKKLYAEHFERSTIHLLSFKIVYGEAAKLAFYLDILRPNMYFNFN